MNEGFRQQVTRAAHGESPAIAWLYQAFAPRLLRRLRARFGPVPALDPEDLLHDTFLYALRNEGRALHRFLEGAGPARPPRDTDTDINGDLDRFLWSAACGVASNRRRSVLRHPVTPLENTRSRDVARGDDGPALARDTLERLAACLAERGEAHHLYFQLRYVDGLTPAEIVTATGWSRKKTYKLKQSLDEALELCFHRLGLP